MEGATNTRPSSNTKMEEEPFQNLQNNSTNSGTKETNPLQKQEPGTYNLKCNTCNQYLATGLQTEKQAEPVIEKHIHGTKCESLHTDFVEPQEPIEDQEETSVWKQIPAHILEQKIQDCSKETQKEIAEKVYEAINQEGEQ